MTLAAVAHADGEDHLERIGRVAIATQGVLYAVVGLLAVQVAGGDRSATPSQKGAIQSVARQPFGRGLLVVLVVGLVAHAGWRLALAIRGDVGDDDGGSLAKRAANLGRAAIYASFVLLAVRLLTSSGGTSSGGSGGTEQKSTATVLSWPGGPWLVVGAGLVVIGTGLWNAKRAVTRSFLEALDLSSLDRGPRRSVEVLGVAGYLARFVAFASVGWFLVDAGRQHDAREARGLDQSLRELAHTGYGPIVLLVVAIGMVLFGAYRVLDACYRKPVEITHA